MVDLPEADAKQLLGQAQLTPEVAALVQRMIAGERDTSTALDEGVGAFADLLFTTDDLITDDIVGDYRIEAVEGRGASGVVYRAYDTRLGRRAALKFVRFTGPGGEPQADRLVAEARVAAAIDHPNVATVFHVGQTDDGTPYIAFKHYDGDLLAKRLGVAAPFELEKTLDLGRQLASGLAAVHSAGLVHRDIKPSNIVVTDEGVLKLLDFGIAATPGGPHDLAGTPSYMSPEQSDGARPDPRTDVWSTGAVLLEMATGEAPFENGANDEERLESALESIDASLAGIVRRCLEADPSRRYRDGTDLLADLVRVAEKKPHPLPTRVWIPIGLGSLGLAAAAWLSFARPADGPGAGGDPPSVAVLAFVSEIDGGGFDPYVTGIADDIIVTLAMSSSVSVTARTSSFAFDATEDDLGAVGEGLGAQTLLTGRVYREHGDTLLDIRLLDAQSGEERWSGSFPGSPAEVPRASREIARAVAAQLGGGADPALAQLSLPSNPQAHHAYLAGRALWHERGSSLGRAIQLLEEAVARDSSHAAAWAALADAHAVSPIYLGTDVAVARELAESAAERALALDDSSSLALAAWGNVQKDFYRDWARAEVALIRAVEVAPNNATAWQWLGEVQQSQGRLEESIASFRRSARLDPLSTPARLSVGILARFTGRSLEASRIFDEVARSDPSFAFVHFWRFVQSIDDADPIASQTAFEAWALGSGLDLPPHLDSWAAIQEHDGREAEEWILGWSNNPITAAFAPMLLAALGEQEAALLLLDQASQGHASGFFLWDPVFDDLRDDPRFVEVTARVLSGSTRP